MANEHSVTGNGGTAGLLRIPLFAVLALVAGSSPASATQAAAGPARIGTSVDVPAGRLQPGSAARYFVRVVNAGAAQAGARLQVASPAGLANRNWTCSASAGGSCAQAGGQGDIDASLDGLPAGGALEFVVDADVAAAPPAHVDIVATALLPAGAACASGQTPPCQSRLSLPTGPQLRLDIATTAVALAPGQVVGYTVRLASADARANAGTILRSPVPKGLVDSRWTCQSGVGACPVASGSGAIEQVLGDFSAGDVQFHVRATVDANPPGTIVQAAAAVPPPGGTCAGNALATAASRSSLCTARAELSTTPRIFASRTPDYSADGYLVGNRFILENRGAGANGSTLKLSVAQGASILGWTCSAVGASCPQASGTGPLDQTVGNWPTSGLLRYDVVSRRDAATTGALDIAMTVVPPRHGSCGPAELRPPCMALDAATPDYPILRLSQGVDRLGAAAGQSVAYTVELANASSELAASDIVLEVPLPAGIEAFTAWTCEAIGASGQCPVAAGSGPLRQQLAGLAPQARLRYVIDARVAAQAPATVIATARLAAPASASLGCPSAGGAAGACVAQAAFSTVPVLALEQSRLAGNLSPGGAADYAFEVLNLGADAGNVRIDNAIPAGLSGATWACTGLAIGCPAASGSGKISASLAQMPAGSGLHYQVAGRVDASPPASISNILTAMPAPRGRCHAGAEDPLTAMPCVERTETRRAPLLALYQSAAQRQLLVGGIADFAVTLKNLGSLANGTLLDIPLPEGIERADWTCTGFAGAVCPRSAASGAISETIPALPADGSLNYSIRAVINQDAATRITQAASVTPPADGSCAGGRCDDSLAVALAEVPAAHLELSVSPARAWAPAGSSPVWTIDLRNRGAETARDFRVATPAPGDGLAILGWTCAGAECPAAQGSGPIDQRIASLAVFDADSPGASAVPGRLLFTVTGQLDSHPGPEAKLGIELQPARGDTCAPVDCTAESALPTAPDGLPEITIDLQADTSTASPNSPIQYTFSIINTGGSGVANVNAYAIEPAQIASSSWTCFSSGAACPAANGSGAINEVIASMPIGSSVTFVIDALTGNNVQPAIDYQAGVNVDPGVSCNPASCVVQLGIPGEYELALSLTADVGQIQPDGNVRYTYRVENTGGSDSFGGIEVYTIEPQDFVSTSWTCVATGQVFCPPSGTGPVSFAFSGLPAGESITFTIDATAASTLAPIIDFRGGVRFGGQPGGTGEAPVGQLNCIPQACEVSLSLPSGLGPPARFSISKTADRQVLDPGGIVRYTLRIANTGTEDATSVRLADAIPAGLTSFAWTCVASGETFCPQSSGSGPLDEFFEFMPIGSSLTYSIDAIVAGSASGTVTNRAALVADNIVCTPGSCQAVASLPVRQSATAITVTKSASPASGTPVSAGQSIAWSVIASNAGTASSAPVVLTDTLPVSVTGISVVPDSGVSCNTLAPAPGSSLVCTVAAGFSGDRGVNISATVAAGVSNAVTNTASASGADAPACVACTVSNPILASVDVGIANPRAFSAAGIAGTLVDIANMSSATASATVVTVTPASALRLFATYSGGCTATPGAGGSVTVSCPNPPTSQGVNCSANSCTLASLPQNAAVTLFVALNAGATATVTANVAGDADPSDNTVVLPIGGTP